MKQSHAIGIEKVLIRCLSTELQQECHEALKEAWAAKTGAKTTHQTTATGTLLPLEFADRTATKGSEPTSDAFAEAMGPDPKLAKLRGSHRQVTLCSLNRNRIGRTLSFVNVHSFNGKG